MSRIMEYVLNSCQDGQLKCMLMKGLYSYLGHHTLEYMTTFVQDVDIYGIHK